MKRSVRILLLSLLCAAVPSARGQDAPPPPGFHGRGWHLPPRDDISAEERERRRDEARRRREAWQQMSQEERHQLRSDIRDAGQALYPPRRGHRLPD